MKIDKENSLARYSYKKNKCIITRSDHHLLVCQLDIYWNSKSMKTYNSRHNIFNFKDVEGRKKYKKLTSGNVLSDCFQGKNVLEESQKWFKTLKSILYQSFPMVRTTNRMSFQQSIILEQMDIKSKLQLAIKSIKESNISHSCKIYQIIVIKQKIETTDSLISLLSSEKNARLIRENYENLT